MILPLSASTIVRFYDCPPHQHNNTKRNDTQHNDTQHNDTQYNNIQRYDTWYVVLLCWVSFMLNVFHAHWCK